MRRIRQWLDASYRNHLLGALLLASGGVLALIGVLVYAAAVAVVLGRANADAELVIELALDRAQRRLEGLAEDLAGLSRSPVAVNAIMDTDERTGYLLPTLKSTQERHPGLSALSLLDHRGGVLGTVAQEAGPELPPPLAAEIHAQTLRSEQAVRRMIRAAQGGWTIVFAHPVRFPPTGSIEGALVAVIDLATALRPSEEIRGFRMDVTVGAPEPAARSFLPARVTDWFRAHHDQALALPWAAGPDNTIRLHAHLNAATLWKPLNRVSLFFSLLVGLLFLSIWFFSRRLAEDLSRPVLALTAQVTSQDADRMPALATLREGPIEIRRLSEAFSDLLAALAHRQRILDSRIDQTTSQALQKESQLSAVLNLSVDGFAVLGASGRVEYVNPAFESLTGIAYREVFGKEWAVLSGRLREHADPQWPWPLALALEQRNAPGPGEPAASAPDRLRLLRPRPRYLVPTVWSSDRWPGTLVVHLRDATRETELDRMKSHFLSTAAHELRTPLASISGYAQLQQELAPGDPAVAESARQIHEQCGALAAMLDDLLDLARLEAGASDVFAFATVSLGGLARRAAESYRPPAGRAPVRVLGAANPAVLRADERRLSQALRNLISNAYKYSPEGGEVLVECLERHDGFVGLRVTDHGIGMSTDEAEHAFERFWRADTTGAIPGTGLGLSIVKEIVERHGGSVELESEPGHGTHVTLWIPRLQERRAA